MIEDPRLPPDRLGEAIRTHLSSKGVIVGVVTGIAAPMLAAAILGLIGLLPIDALQYLLGIRYPGEPVTTGARVARSVITPWNGGTIETGPSFAFHWWGLQFWPTLSAVLAVSASGAFARTRLGQLRDRFVALLIAAVVGGAMVALASGLLGYSITEVDGQRYSYDYSITTGFVQTLTLTLLIGIFSFGVAGRLREPLRTVSRVSGMLIATIWIGVVVLTSIALGVSTGHPQGRSEIYPEVVNAGYYVGGIAAAAVPLATGSEVKLHALPSSSGSTNFDSPLVNFTKQFDDVIYWPALQDYTSTHRDGRLLSYAGTGGAAARLVAVALALLILAAWAAGALWAVSALGAPTSAHGLRLGALLGGVGGLALMILGRLATTRVSGLPGNGYWGTTFQASLQALVVLAVVAGATGAVYAAFRPRPATYEPLRFRTPTWVAATPAAASAAQTNSDTTPAPAANAPTVGGAYCGRCGARLRDEARFCGTCGAARPAAAS